MKKRSDDDTKKIFDISALGYCSIDHVCLIPSIPRDDKVEINELLTGGGGPAATAAFTAARLGAKTAYLGAVGDDENGKTILRELREAGVDISGVACRRNAISPVAYCWVEQSSGRRSIAWSHGAIEPLRAGEIKKYIMYSSKILLLDGHHPEAALKTAKTAREHGTRVLLDAGTFRPHMKKLMSYSDIVIASESFAEQMTGKNDPKSALQKIHSFGPSWSVVTLGGKGSIAYDGENFITQKAFKINIVDTTGAGDVYHGAFAYKCLACDDLAKTMRFASAVSAMKCRKLGGRGGIPTLREVNKFIRNSELS